jgi:hypothetical protein
MRLDLVLFRCTHDRKPPISLTKHETINTAYAVLFRGGAATFSRKPFLKRRDSVRMYRMRPVPCTFRRFAFSLQLSASVHPTISERQGEIVVHGYRRASAHAQQYTTAGHASKEARAQPNTTGRRVDITTCTQRPRTITIEENGREVRQGERLRDRGKAEKGK